MDTKQRRILVAGVLALFALNFLWQTVFFIADFTPGMLESGLTRGPQLAFPLVGILFGVLFLALAFYFGLSAVRILRDDREAVVGAGKTCGRLALLCLLYLVLYYTVSRPRALAFDPTRQMSLFPWGIILATMLAATAYYFARGLAGEKESRSPNLTK